MVEKNSCKMEKEDSIVEMKNIFFDMSSCIDLVWTNNKMMTINRGFKSLLFAFKVETK